MLINMNNYEAYPITLIYYNINFNTRLLTNIMLLCLSNFIKQRIPYPKHYQTSYFSPGVQGVWHKNKSSSKGKCLWKTSNLLGNTEPSRDWGAYIGRLLRYWQYFR